MRYRLDKETKVFHHKRSLDYMYDFFFEKGFRFQLEILTRYYLSLKTKPLVILTGISGTGKTKIAQLFAEYTCQGDEEAERRQRIAFIPVRPDWTDNRGLLGFYNLLDERYHAEPLLKLLLHAKEHPNKPHFVILDEMNLAKVEYYFSDFLSVMESRTEDRPEGAYIRLHAKESAETPDGKPIPAEIQIPSNVFFTGTVNIDETTYMFSPKVLDRANVIEFNEVSIFEEPSDDTGFRLKNPDVRDGLNGVDAFCSLRDFDQLKSRTECDVVSRFTNLYRQLKQHHTHFGFRVANEMSRFINLAFDEVDGCREDEVLDIQILQKVLPKLHGTRAKLEQPLKILGEFCRHHGLSRSQAKVDRMKENLKQGYTSFIES
jgi:5-methylcytosine-specific restriction endonuclease McrBC GTP-binding regulatory subunit McrB